MILAYDISIIMGKNIQEIREVKGFLPRSIVYAERIDEDFAEGIAGFYKSIWAEREGGLSMKQKHLMVLLLPAPTIILKVRSRSWRGFISLGPQKLKSRML